jgi:hypothetical protein
MTTQDGAGNVKGNVDAELVLWATSDFYEGKYDRAVVVSSDGDFACLVSFLMKRGKLEVVVSPAISAKCSFLIRRTKAPITYLNDIRGHVEEAKNERAPGADGTAAGPLS